jgi:hypothetical protein
LAAREAVKLADGHFSGEHYKRSLLETNKAMVNLFFTPEARKAWQTGLLSFTWQREHILVAKNVMKSFMPDRMIKALGMKDMSKAIKKEYRKYSLGGAMIVAAVDMYNFMATEIMDGEGKHIWENPPGQGFGVRALWDEPGYTLIDDDGKERFVEGGRAYVRPLKSLFEVAEWGAKPIRKAAYKMAPWVSAAAAIFFPGEYDTEFKSFSDVPNAVGQFLTEVAVPISVTQWAAYLRGKKSGKAAVLPFFGLPVSKVDFEVEIVEDYYNKQRKRAITAIATDDTEKFDKIIEEVSGKYPALASYLQSTLGTGVRAEVRRLWLLKYKNEMEPKEQILFNNVTRNVINSIITKQRENK